MPFMSNNISCHGTIINSLHVLMCRKAVNQSVSQSISDYIIIEAVVLVIACLPLGGYINCRRVMYYVCNIRRSALVCRLQQLLDSPPVKIQQGTVNTSVCFVLDRDDPSFDRRTGRMFEIGRCMFVGPPIHTPRTGPWDSCPRWIEIGSRRSMRIELSLWIRIGKSINNVNQVEYSCFEISFNWLSRCCCFYCTEITHI